MQHRWRLAVVAFLACSAPALAQPLPAGPPPPPAPVAPGAVVDGPDAPPAEDEFRPTQTTSAFPYYAWGRSEFLLWTIKKGSASPPLITTGPADAANPAALTDPTTTVLFPTGSVDYHAFEGGRWAVGTWFDPCETCGAEITGLLLVRRSTTFSAQSDAGGTPVLGVPFIDASTGAETVNFASFPGRFAGGVTLTSSAMVWGMEGTFYEDWGETTLRFDGNPFPLGDLRTHLLGGFRYLSLEEDFNLTQPSLVLPDGGADFNGAALQTGDLEVIRDSFNARSQFFGGQVGLRSEFDRGPFYAEFTGKVGLGDSHESVLVSGDTTLVPAATGTPVVAPVGSWRPRPTSGGRAQTGSPSCRSATSTWDISPARCCASSSATASSTGATWSAPRTRSTEP